MNDQQTVVVYGSSIFSRGIEISLRNKGRFLVMQVDDTQLNAEEHITLLAPHIVIVDMATVSSQVVLTYLRKNPDRTLIGLDPHTSTMMVLRGQGTTLASMQELVAAIEQHMR